MTYKASSKKKNSNKDSDSTFAPKGGLAISSTITSSRRRSPRIKTIADIYGAYDSTTSSELELDSSDNSSCDSYHIKLESVEEADNPFSIDTWNNTRERYKIKKRKAMKSDMPEEEFDLDEPLISLKVTKGKKRRKLFKPTKDSSVDKVWISREASSLKSNNVTEGEDENVGVVSDKNIFDSGISESTHSLSSGVVETCDDVKCSMKANPTTDVSISASESGSNVAVVNSIKINSTHDVTASVSESFAFNSVSEIKSNVTVINSEEINSTLDVSASVNCSREVKPVGNVSTSVSEIKNNIEVTNSVETNNTHDVSASDEHTNPSVEGYNSSDKVIVTFEGFLGKSDDTAISIQSQDSCVDEVESMKTASRTHIVQSNEEHFKNGRSTNTSDTCDIIPSYSESSTWTSSTSDSQVVISNRSYDAIVYDNKRTCVNTSESINNFTEFRLGNRGEKLVIQETCNFGNDSAYKDVGSLDSLVFQALCGDAHINNDESRIQLMVENNTSVEAYSSSHPKHSDTLFSLPSDLHSMTISSQANSVSSSVEIQTPTKAVKAANNFQSSSEMKFSLVEGEELNSANEPKSNPEANHEDQNYPKNLLQNRKEFSPISQEKLCWYDDELDDTRKALGHVTDSIPSPEITKRRLKRNKKLPHRPKDCSDGNSLCVQTSINTPSQKAVLFSQRQMQDIENIAGKLLKEMSCLKNIVAAVMNTDNVASESCIFSFAKFTPEEITAAVGSASNLEATTKKWLAMMSRDCNRFCKIMGSTDSNVSTPVVASKQSRKVTFADEAGGSLCNVKVFEQPPTADTQVEPKNDNPTSN